MADGRHEYWVQAELVTQSGKPPAALCVTEEMRVWGLSGQLGRLRPELSSQFVGTGSCSLADRNSTEVNSTQHCVDPILVSPVLHENEWGPGSGPRLGGRGGRGRGPTEARRFPVRVCQCRGGSSSSPRYCSSAHHTSLARVPGPRRAGRAVQSFPFPQAGLLHS